MVILSHLFTDLWCTCYRIQIIFCIIADYDQTTWATVTPFLHSFMTNTKCSTPDQTFSHQLNLIHLLLNTDRLNGFNGIANWWHIRTPNSHFYVSLWGLLSAELGPKTINCEEERSQPDDWQALPLWCYGGEKNNRTLSH